MKRQLALFGFLLILVFGVDSVTAEMDSALSKQVMMKGKNSAGKLLKTLQGELKGALKGKDFPKAFDICANKATSITESVQESLKEGIVVRRSSDRARNPENRADKDELAAIEFFRSQLKEQGSFPEALVREESREGKAVYSFYKPLVTKELCLACHGARAQISPEIAKLLDKYYPEDKAVGYGEGELRGVARASMERSLFPSN